MADDIHKTNSTLVSETGQSRTTTAPPSDDQTAQLAALNAELESLKGSVAAIASTAKRLAGTSVNDALAETEEMLKRNVFASVGIAAFIGYVWGRTR